MREVASGIGQGLLNNIRRVQPRNQATVQPHRDHPFETRAMVLEQPLEGLVITLTGSCQQCIGLVTVVRHPHEPSHDKTNEK
jgi:hypothetical protein